MALLPVAEALSRILQDAAPLPAEDVPLAQAAGRVLAADVAARITQPPADVSAMDGYAVRADDVASIPARLKVIGEVAAGHPFAAPVAAGEAARIFTGGVLPAGADTVVIQENTTRQDDVVVINASVARGKNVRLRGLDFKQGDVLLPKGRRLTARDLMLAAAMNHPAVPLHRVPKVAVLGTGDELQWPGSELKPGQVVYSNGFALSALARQEGASAIDLGIAPDRLDAIAGAVRRARELGADILVTAGGASVGDHDLVQQSLAAEGLALSFWKVALRPGRPVMHGRLGDMHVLGVPGNPVSSYVCALLFLVPLIRRLSGRTDLSAASESAVLGGDLPANDERMDFLRATLRPGPKGKPVATPLPVQDSSMMAALAKADCLLIREANAPALLSGSECPIVKLRF
ncbi:MAG TPA: gephyrin-like molybdotransferase Glp [Xanthobacteraceae bacterium]|nr:gephyrin-like molybdotransferase Glp [Xanthobacteraceae bacterium]